MKSAAEKCGLESDQSLRAYYREFRRVVELSDVILEVLDARDPLGCRCLQVEQAVLTAPGANKKLILILNKIGGFVLGIFSVEPPKRGRMVTSHFFPLEEMLSSLQRFIWDLLGPRNFAFGPLSEVPL